MADQTDSQDKQYGSPEYIQGLLDSAVDFEAQYGNQPSAWERMRELQDKMNNVVPIPMNPQKPVGPIPTTPSWKKDQSLTVDAQEEIGKLQQLRNDIDARIQYLGTGGTPTGAGSTMPTGLLV